MDTKIAAHALAEGLILVTNNTDDFRQADGLVLENWTLNHAT
jgi:tRNA(fMet)-specific endonuclease VapC